MHSNRSWILRAVAGTTGAVALTLSAGAQQFPSCPLTTNGPDVIVGDLSGPQNYNVSSSMDALAFGTTSCNVGDAQLNWFANTVNHPVIGGGLFKYKVVNGAGRYEEVGQSWLKHAFAALSQSLCCNNCVGDFTQQHLGVGCSDPYTASRNGSQSGLGPKFQVNAHLGAYIASHPTPSGGNNGRVQIALSDLEPSSGAVRYIGEMMYVAPDDAKQDNNDNNTSYREVSVTGTASNYTFGYIGNTVRMQAGVQAWKALDPLVTLTNIAAPEDTAAGFEGTSRLILGSRVTDLGGGQWHYEYALYNMNSDRSIQAFALPIPAGVNVTNIGFHDVDYLAGDGNGSVNFDGTDWAGSVSLGMLTWQTSTFASNANANALRWGTTYNFRFDADVPPASGDVSLTQYKTVNNFNVSNVDVPGSTPITAFCAGDGSSVPCPCGNTGSPNSGCANSAFASGATLTGSGTASVSSDNVVLTSNNMTGSTCVFFQGTAQMAPVIVDDGLGCVTGTVVRLGTKVIGGNASQYPALGDLSVSVRGAVPGSGGTRYYQCFYRNAAAAFCPPATSNRSNGVAIVWAP